MSPYNIDIYIYILYLCSPNRREVIDYPEKETDRTQIETSIFRHREAILPCADNQYTNSKRRQLTAK